MYESVLKGTDGTLLTPADARGIELEDAGEERIEPVPGNTLTVSLDVNIQKYAEQAAYQVMEQKGAKAVSIIIMDPRNGEIYAMVNAPEFDLNDPFSLTRDTAPWEAAEEQENADGSAEAGVQAALNQMWRNRCINDTYEPGSTFKIITAAAGLEQGAVSLTDRFFCPGFRIVEDRRIRCHKTGGHGSETFLEGAMNSATRCLSTWDSGWERRRFTTILNSLGSWKRPGSIFRARRPRSCTKRKISDWWSWPPFPLASPSRLHRSS